LPADSAPEGSRADRLKGLNMLSRAKPPLSGDGE
jgi:hypothetical protein